MKKKDHADKKKDQPKKTPHQFKDFVPSSLFQNLQPQSQIILPQDKQQSTFNYQSIYSLKPNDPLPDWDYKTSDEVNKDIYDDDPQQQQQPTSSKLYYDPDHVHIVNNLPLYFVQIHDNDFIWVRPSEYVPNYHIDREIKRLYPKKNYTSMRDDIKKTYTKIKRMQMQTDKNNDEDEEEEEEDIDTYLKNDEITMKQTIYKDFYKHLETEYEYYIVNCDTRIETDEEYIKRKELEEKEKTHNKKGNKKQNKNKNVPIKIEENDKLTYRIVKPSMLNLNEFKSNTLMHNSFYAWYASIFQMIIDMDITDCYTNKSVLYNIYPQKDNAPVYNPQGKYIVKLYHMGKAKKIVIDDRMPCNKDQEFILPQCTNIEELWPALLVKALLKLNMYKTRHPCYYAKEEFMDVSVIHALTGMHVIAMDVNNEIITLFKDEFKVRAIPSGVNANGGNANTNSENDTNTVNNVNNNNEQQQQQPIYQNDKVYYALYHFKPSRFMIIDSEMYSYYDYIERIEFSKQKSGAFINSLNLQENKIVLVKNTNGVVFSRIKQRSGTIRIDKPFSYNSNSNSSSAFINQLSSLNFQPLDKTNAVGDGNNNNNNKDNKKKQLRNKKRFPTLIQAKKLNINLKRKENLISTTNIISNYVYPINDFFTNEDFNMRRLKFMDFSDLERVLNDRKVQFKQLALNEKKQYLIARKELKIKQIEEKNRRLNELKEKGNEYVLLKITDRAVDAPEIEFFKEYNENEINLAKKCLLNNWMFPPVEFFENDFKRREEIKRQQWLLALSMAKDKKDEEESNTQKEVSVKKKKKKNLNLTRSRKDETLINANAVNQQVEEVVNNNMGNEITTQQQQQVVQQQQQSQQIQQQPQQHKKKKKKYGPFAWNQELYVEYIGGNTDIYKTNNIEPMHSLIPGKWLTTSDMMLNFNKLLIIQNHNKIYHNKILADNNWNYYTTDSFESLAEYNSFILTYDRTSKDEDDPLDKEYSILIIFEPFNEEMQEHIDCRAIFQPFISFDLIKISNGMEIPIQSNILLNKFYSIYTYTHLNRNEVYLIKIVGGTFPMGYVLQVMTENHNIRNLTHDQYLKEYQHYTLTSFHCEHPIIEQDKFYLISRIAVLVSDDDNNNNNNSNINNEQQSSSHCEDANDGSVIIPSSLQDEITFKLTLKYNPIYFKQYIRIFIIREDSDMKKEVEPNKPFKMNGSDFIKSQQQQIQNDEILNSSNSSSNNNNMSTQKQNPNTSTNAFNNNHTTSSNKYYKYYFVIYMKSQYTTKEGAFDIDILSDDKLIKFELIEHIDPFEIHEKYTPNKKGIVFGYYIYPSEKITCSLNISLYHILKEIKTEAQKETTSKSKGKSQSNTVNPITNNIYIETSSLQNKVHCISELYHLTKEPSLDFVKDSLKFSYSNQGELIGKWHFYNTLTLVNLNLNGELLIQDKDPKKKGKKDQSIDTKQLSTTNYPYLLLCYFDITEVNKDIIDDINNNIGYTIRVFASNSIAFIKDTSKEDHEKLMIDEWEAKDEGRSLRAVKSRKKYLLYEKAQRNDVLNTEENKELNEERERRKANQIDHIEEEETTNANANVKGAKGRDNKRKRSLKVKEPVNKKGNVKGKQTDKDKNDKPQEDEYGIHSNLFRCILKNRELSMKNIFQTPLPKCEESKSQYILNYIKYTYRNRSITKTPTARNGNTINDNIILADDNYRNTVKRNILNKYEESELLLKNKHSFMNCTINEMNDNIKQLTRNLSMTRILRKEKSEKLFKARNTIKAELDKRCDIVKKINNVMKDKNKTINDFSQILSIYKDAITILGDNNELVQTYFKYCSAKREEMIKQDIKKYTPKDKNTIIKLLEEINTSKWLISDETLNTLQSLIK